MGSDRFRIHCTCVVKNEVDVIVYCLSAASRWADRIYVFDNGSTDGTWEAVLGCKSERIVPWKQEGTVFGDRLRANLFNAFRHEAAPGDWWCRLDADEFYVDDPRKFLAGVGKFEHVVWGLPIEYYITDRDLDSINFHDSADHVLPQLRYYAIRNSEARFFRHRRRLSWVDGAWPRHMGLVHPRRIRYRHYKYRSPDQIQQRLDTRRQAIEQGTVMWWSQQPKAWRDAVVPAEDLSRDDQSGDFVFDETVLPSHVEPPVRRIAKRLLHGCGVWP